MGRRSVPLSDPDRWVFNRVADAYRARPPYPDAVVERLVSLAGGAGGRAVDLGAGTGLLTFPLAARGLQVSAVEPAARMLAVAAERRAGGEPPVAGRVGLVHATAEDTGLPGGAFDLALLADAVQWVDPERAGREAARLVRPGGAIAVVEAVFAATPFMGAVAALLARANPRARPRPPGRARQLLAIAAGGGAGEPRHERFHHEHPLDATSLELLVRSLSYAGPALGPAALTSLVGEARALLQASPDARLARDLTLCWATARRPRA